MATLTKVKVNLIGEDGNAFSILAKVMRELRKAGMSDDVVSEYYAQATADDYDHLLRVTSQWVKVV